MSRFALPSSVIGKPMSGRETRNGGMSQSDIEDIFDRAQDLIDPSTTERLPGEESALDDDLKRRAWETYFWVNWVNTRLPIPMRQMIANELRPGPAPNEPYLINRANSLLRMRREGGDWFPPQDSDPTQPSTARAGRLERVGEERKVLEATIKEVAENAGFARPQEPPAPSFQEVLQLEIPKFDFRTPLQYGPGQTPQPRDGRQPGPYRGSGSEKRDNTGLIIGGLALAGLVGLFIMQQNR